MEQAAGSGHPVLRFVRESGSNIPDIPVWLAKQSIVDVAAPDRELDLLFRPHALSPYTVGACWPRLLATAEDRLGRREVHGCLPSRKKQDASRP